VVLRQNTLDRGFKGIGLRAVFRSAQQQHYFNCPCVRPTHAPHRVPRIPQQRTDRRHSVLRVEIFT